MIIDVGGSLMNTVDTEKTDIYYFRCILEALIIQYTKSVKCFKLTAHMPLISIAVRIIQYPNWQSKTDIILVYM